MSIDNERPGPLVREEYHPLRAAKYWPDYVAMMSRLCRPWKMYPTSEQIEEIKETMHKLYSKEVEKADLENRPKHIDPMMEHLERGIRYGFLAGSGLNIYSIAPHVRDAIKKTSLSGIRLGDLRTPFETVYIGFDRGSGIYFDHDNAKANLIVDGAYLRKIERHSEGDTHLEICLTTRDRLGVLRHGYVDHWALQREPHFTFDLIGQPDQTIEEILGFAIQNGDMDLEPDEEATDEFRTTIADAQAEFLEKGVHVTVPTMTGPERRAAFRNQNLEEARKGLSVVLGALCVLTSRMDGDAAPPDEVWPKDAPAALVDRLENGLSPKARKKALNDLKKSGHMLIKRIVIDGSSQVQRLDRGPMPGTNEKVAHWRSGHMRRQPHGPKNAEIKLIWIMPTFVGGDDDGRVGGRLIRVSKTKKGQMNDKSS
ncbi:hypothetical protein [Phaeobacter inhibens]|uniref:hypothetical protein n=1 Tax=Phaeobacter inhibens TaxID=221822 RepID=UPI000CA34A84|nr:hypothetical protein [Phaeobacter inhibens]AUR22532.1 hypothetical protein PhaeoP80_04509 [Phaeobacter inhibens]